MRPTDEQVPIIDAVARGQQSVKVEAGAGTGKTSTLVAAAQARKEANPQRSSGLIVVFNALMAKETKPRLAGTGCVSRTMHSIAFQSDAARPFRETERHRMMLPARMAAESVGIRGPVIITPEVGPTTRNGIGYIMLDWVRRYCSSSDAAIGPQHFPRNTLREFLPNDLAKRAQTDPHWFNLVCQSYASELGGNAKKLWKLMSDPEQSFPSMDDVYLKLYMLSEPRVDYDYVALDEAQDANPLMLQYMHLAQKSGAQVVYVGDEHQQMYSWRGAVNAMRQIETDLKLPLSKSFRFGPHVAEVANAILGQMIGTEFRIEGAGRPTRVVATMQAPTAVISRTNAQSIEGALEMLKADGKPGLCMGKSEVVGAINSLESFKSIGRSDSRRFCRFQTYDELVEAVQNGDAPDLKVILEVVDEHGFASARQILETMAVGKSPEDIARSGAQTIFLTGHASKGLQFSQVKLGDDFKGLEELAKKRADLTEELNILYVSVTRAQDALCLGESPARTDIINAVRAGRGLAPIEGEKKTERPDAVAA